MKYIIINLTLIFFLTSCSSSKGSDLVSKFESNTDLFKELALKARYCSGYGYNDKKKAKENICRKITKKLGIDYIFVERTRCKKDNQNMEGDAIKRRALYWR